MTRKTKNQASDEAIKYFLNGIIHDEKLLVVLTKTGLVHDTSGNFRDRCSHLADDITTFPLLR